MKKSGHRKVKNYGKSKKWMLLQTSNVLVFIGALTKSRIKNWPQKI